MKTSSYALMLLVAVASMAACGKAPVVGVGSSSTTSDSRSSETPAGGPFLHGELTTLDAARGKAGFHVYVPATDLASESNLTAVWIEQSSGTEAGSHVALEFDTGVEITEQPAFFDPEAHYALGASDLGLGPQAVRTIHSVPALVIGGSATPNGTPQSGPTVVDLTLEQVQVTIYGPTDLDVTRLIDIAESLT